MGKHAEPVADNTTPQPVIIVGSYFWANWSAVTDALGSVIDMHPRIQLITSGCPTGAEWFASEYVKGLGDDHPVPVTMRDEELARVEHAIVLGFVRNGSPGATAVLDKLKRIFWTRIISDDTFEQHSEWGLR